MISGGSWEGGFGAQLLSWVGALLGALIDPLDTPDLVHLLHRNNIISAHPLLFCTCPTLMAKDVSVKWS